MRYEVHVSRWERDALCVIREHARNAKELLRIHVMGGSGTLSEAVDSTINLPNIQIAAYPFGYENIFLRYFGVDKTHLFSSIRSQVVSGTTLVDAIRCGERYGLCHGVVGFEALSASEAISISESNLRHQDVSYFLTMFKKLFYDEHFGQEYKIELDGKQLDGSYLSIRIANGSYYTKSKNHLADAYPNDGFFDVYFMKKMSRITFLSNIRKYLAGNYRKTPELFSCYRGKKLLISSDIGMNMTIDDKPFYGTSAEFEILPYAIDFVCPGGIEIKEVSN
jgi:diacylglycerol kinase family enzyme